LCLAPQVEILTLARLALATASENAFIGLWTISFAIKELKDGSVR